LSHAQTLKNIPNSTLSHSDSQKHTKFHSDSHKLTKFHFVSHSDSQKHTKFHFVSQNSTLSHTRTQKHIQQLHSDAQKHTKFHFVALRLTKTYENSTQTPKNIQNFHFISQSQNDTKSHFVSHSDSQKHTKFHFVSLRLTKIYKIPVCLTLRLSKNITFHLSSQNFRFFEILRLTKTYQIFFKNF
jgi:hypothetical protein